MQFGSFSTKLTRQFWFVLFLLVVFSSRINWIGGMSFDLDEVRSAMRALGTVPQIIAWQPEDWPPLYNVLLGFWQRLTSSNPITLRYSSVLIFLPSLALMFVMTRRITKSERAAWSATLVYAALSYSTFLSLYLRAYSLALTLLPILLLLTDIYFRASRSRQWLWAIAVGVTIAGLFYTTYTAIFAFVWVGLYTLICYPRRIWRWFPPIGLSFLLVLPELVRKASIFQDRLTSSSRPAVIIHQPLDVYQSVFQEIVGPFMWVWVVVLVIGVMSALVSPKKSWLLIWLLAWALLAPFVLYIMLNQRIYYFLSVRYIWWSLTGVALLLGVLLSSAPRLLWWGSHGVLIALMFLSFSTEMYPEKHEHYEDSFLWLSENIEAGDVMMVDPNICHLTCFDYDRWVYYEQVFLDQHLRIVDEPADYQRIWYVHSTTDYDADLLNAITDGRLSSRFVGPSGHLFQLWQGPPDPEGILFGDDLRFHGIEWIDKDVSGLLFPEQTSIHVRLWWSVDHVPTQAYSVSLQLLDETGQIVIQSDETPSAVYLNPAFFEPLPIDMTGWEPQQLYVEERTLEIPALDDKIWADVFLVVYQWWDGERLQADGVNTDRLSLGLIGLLGW